MEVGVTDVEIHGFGDLSNERAVEDLSKILYMNNKSVLLISPFLLNLQFPAMWIEIVMSTPPATGLAKSSDTFAPASRVSEAMDTTASQSAMTPVKLLVA